MVVVRALFAAHKPLIGTGKSVLLREIIKVFKDRKLEMVRQGADKNDPIEVEITAPTGTCVLQLFYLLFDRKHRRHCFGQCRWTHNLLVGWNRTGQRAGEEACGKDMQLYGTQESVDELCHPRHR